MSKLKPAKYHDIYLAGELKKDFISEKETFEKQYVSAVSVDMLNKSQMSQNALNSINILNSLLAKAYYFEDSDGIIFKSIDLFYKRAQVSDHIALGVDVGLFSIERYEKKYSGIRYGGTLFYDNFSLRLGVNDYDDFSEFVPTVTYANTYKRHSYGLEYTRQNALFYTYSLIPYEKRIVANHFSATDFISFENKTDLWANIEVNFFSNADTEVTAQFDWIFYKDSAFTPKFTYNFAVEGWYTSHSKQHNDFYSPYFADTTLLRIDPMYLFSRYFGLRAKIGLGYSFSDETTPYKYGLWAFGEPVNNLSYSIGCLQSNAARLSNGPNYHYVECDANLGYSW